MRRIIKEKDDIKVSIFSEGRLVRVFSRLRQNS